MPYRPCSSSPIASSRILRDCVTTRRSVLRSDLSIYLTMPFHLAEYRLWLKLHLIGKHGGVALLAVCYLQMSAVDSPYYYSKIILTPSSRSLRRYSCRRSTALRTDSLESRASVKKSDSLTRSIFSWGAIICCMRTMTCALRPPSAARSELSCPSEALQKRQCNVKSPTRATPLFCSSSPSSQARDNKGARRSADNVSSMRFHSARPLISSMA